VSPLIAVAALTYVCGTYLCGPPGPRSQKGMHNMSTTHNLKKHHPQPEENGGGALLSGRCRAGRTWAGIGHRPTPTPSTTGRCRNPRAVARAASMYGGDDHEGRLASCGDQCADLTARVRLAPADPAPNGQPRTRICGRRRNCRSCELPVSAVTSTDRAVRRTGASPARRRRAVRRS
jgi:hypothetical protein